MKKRKSVVGELRKMFNNEKEPDLPAVPPKYPIDTPLTALCIRHYGMVQERRLTFYGKHDKSFLIGNNRYQVPRCMQPPGSTELDPSILRFTWVFKPELASESTTAATLASLKGAYSIWYKDPTKTSTASRKTLAETEGDFWMLKQVQDEPGPGELVEWEDIPKEMLQHLKDDWWSMGVQWTDISSQMATCSTESPD